MSLPTERYGNNYTIDYVMGKSLCDVFVFCVCLFKSFFIPCLLGCTNSGSIFSMVNLTFAHTKKQFQYALCISSISICSLKSLIVPLHCLLCCKTVLIYTHNEPF